ncbi:hypothetical protein KKE88_00350 [Patescibacteria group bacterium]|nr:hypothetical protein [Patescibacteria group bacterium]
MPELNNNTKIDINEEEAMLDEVLKSKEVREKLEKLAGAVIKKYPTNKKIKSKI